MKINFPQLYNICLDPTIKVADCFVRGMWNIQFVWNFGKEEAVQWELLKDLLEGVDLNSDKDKMVWCLCTDIWSLVGLQIEE